MKVYQSNRRKVLKSKCGLYRLRLDELLPISGRSLVFIGLNPSKGDSYTNDKTLIRLKTFSKEWGYEKLTVVNLFSRISKDPNMIKKARNPIGNFNNEILDDVIKEWSMNSKVDMWLAWGNKGALLNRDKAIIKKIKSYTNNIEKENNKRLYVLKLTKEGQPMHPLYAKKKSELERITILANLQLSILAEQ
ncbi:DUF1643 domain-containing protein [Prochlorococcus sp. MIT 1223]|uniref:DUF1643 domain-containing protein n=1 Tax=Prochlorococcus sp. MIT 1223 TaxID=3096217 RepID=UPI002A75D376|nr:DUF1643 domain-containing protein [Prochlorococcus sp. MIT 1223]